ncbi:hypothetical protein E3Q20_00478 [Wallemia mellicola]|nr:hypothetical protein E3Q20_00478 [Wallemia mellicola]
MSLIYRSLKPRQISKLLTRSYSQQPANSDPDSTSAYQYKLEHSPRRPPPLPAQEPPRRWTAEESVKNILYNTPPPLTQPFKRHILNALVQNEPGVLSRVSEVRDLSRMCICIRGQDAVVEQARRQLEDLVPVWAVLDYTNTSVIERELLLVKVSLLGPEYFNEHFKPSSSDPSFSLESARTYDEAITQFSNTQRPSEVQEDLTKMSLSEALRTKHAHLSALKNLAEQFSGKLVDVSSDSVIVEVTGKSTRLDAFLGLVRAFGVLEASRTGMMVMPRTPLPASWAEEIDAAAEIDEVDSSLLPPVEMPGGSRDENIISQSIHSHTSPARSTSVAVDIDKPYLPSIYTGMNTSTDDDHLSNPDEYDWALFMSAYAAGRWDPFEIPRPPLKTNSAALSVDSRRTYSAHRALDKIDGFTTSRRNSSINESYLPSNPSTFLEPQSPSNSTPVSGQKTRSAPMSHASSVSEDIDDNETSLYPINLSSTQQNLAFGPDLAVQVATHSLIHSDDINKKLFKGTEDATDRPASAPEGSKQRDLKSALPSQTYDDTKQSSTGYMDYVSPTPQSKVAPLNANDRQFSYESELSTDTSTPTNTRPHFLNREDSDRTVMNDTTPSRQPDQPDLDKLTEAFDHQHIIDPTSPVTSVKALPIEMNSIKDPIPSRLSSDRIQNLAEKQFSELSYLVPPLPLNEDARRKELFKFDLLRGTPDLSLDRILHLVKLVFQTKCVIISLVNGENVVLKAHTGYEEMFETDIRVNEPRKTALSSHAILQQNDEPDILEMNSAGNSKSSNVSDMQKVYDKAATLIKDTLGVEGALVLDISQFEIAENLGDDNELYMPDPITQSQRETPTRTSSSSNLNALKRDNRSQSQWPAINRSGSDDTYARSIPILAAAEDGPIPSNRFQPVSEENSEKLAWFLKRNPDGYIFDYGLIPGVFRQFVGVKEKYGMAIVPIFNLSNDKDGPFALLVAYTGDRKLLLEGYEIQFLRAMGVIILSAVLKERILLADKAKQNFISNISHELRTPLHGILAAAELLQDTELDEVQVEFLDTVKACGRSLSETLNHVLDFTKLSGSNTSAGVERGIKLSKVNLKNLVEEAVESTIIGYRGRFAASSEGLGDIYAPPSSSSASSPSLTTQKVDQISKSLPVEILVDVQFRSNWNCKCEKAGLRRVLQNLVGNSQKFTKSGYIMVILREAPHSPGSKKLPIEIVVIDTGKGMSKSFLDSQVFQPFSQEDPLQAGTGLGLAIVSSIIKSPSVNGQIDIRSREDVGTEIKMTIPVEMIDNKSEEEEKSLTQENIIEKLGYSSNWKPKVTLHGFDTNSMGGEALINVTSNYIRSWLGLECALSTPQNNVYGDILVINEAQEMLLALIQEREISKPIVLISSSRADKQLYKAKVEYERLGGIARIIYKPAGPTKFDSVMIALINSLAQRSGHARTEKRSNSNFDFFRNLPMPSPAESSGSNKSDYFSEANQSYNSSSGGTPDDHWREQMSEYLSPSGQRTNSTENLMSIQRRNSDKSTQPSANLPTRPSMTPRSVTYHVSPSTSHSKDNNGGTHNGSSPSTPGSTISISGAGAILKTSAENEPVKAHGQPFRVLCVDDNAINLNLLTKFLKKKGCEYVEATDGKQAVDIVNSTGPGYFSVILMDVSMPVMDGLQATSEIREIEHQRRKEMREQKDKFGQKSYLNAKSGEVTPPAKIFALTGLAAKEDRRRAFAAGVDGYLIKPASFKSLDLLLSRIGVTTHNTSSGRPARDVAIELFTGQENDDYKSTTNEKGRCEDIIPNRSLSKGRYQLRFHTGEYWEKQGIRPFHPIIDVHFEIYDESEHYHIPLLITPASYTTYRGS